LAALLMIVAVAAAVRWADPETTPLPIVPHTEVSVMSDPRIVESSGLAASQAHPGLVYTVNDSGDVARVFVVDIASGAVVGVTTVKNATWNDAEAMALWGGKLWIADIGANRGVSGGRALYAFDEPGAGNHEVTADRYPITLDVGAAGIESAAVETEAIAIVPGRVYLFSKGWPNGRAFRVIGRLTTSGSNVARVTNRLAPAWTTDATATPDGRYVLLHGIVQVDVRDARTWQLVHTDVIPMLKQGETIAAEASGRAYLIGSEGTDSPLVRIAFNPAMFTSPPPSIDPKDQIRAQHPVKAVLWEHRVWGRLVRAAPFVLAGLVLVAAAWWAKRWRRRRSGSTESK
jgi:hypothetical protein